MLVFNDQNKACAVYVFYYPLFEEYTLELIDRKTGDTVISEVNKDTESTAIEKVKQWMEAY